MISDSEIDALRKEFVRRTEMDKCIADSFLAFQKELGLHPLEVTKGTIDYTPKINDALKSLIKEVLVDYLTERERDASSSK